MEEQPAATIAAILAFLGNIYPGSGARFSAGWIGPPAVALIEPAAVAAYGVERAGVGPGDRVLVTGAGPIGALAALCARSAGARAGTVADGPSDSALSFAQVRRCGPRISEQGVGT